MGFPGKGREEKKKKINFGESACSARVSLMVFVTGFIFFNSINNVCCRSFFFTGMQFLLEKKILPLLRFKGISN